MFFFENIEVIVLGCAVLSLLYGAVGARWLLPRASAAGRGLVFGALLLAVYSPGIRPPWPLTFALFAPAFLAYGLLLSVLWARWVHRPAA